MEMLSCIFGSKCSRWCCCRFAADTSTVFAVFGNECGLVGRPTKENVELLCQELGSLLANQKSKRVRPLCIPQQLLVGPSSLFLALIDTAGPTTMPTNADRSMSVRNQSPSIQSPSAL